MTTEITPLEAENRELAKNFDKQLALFEKFGYKNPGPHLMGHYMVVKTADGFYKMTKRERPVDFMFDNDGHARCVASSQRTYAERLGGMEMPTHPNPATAKAVIDNLLCQSVEAGEVAAWANV